MRVDTATRAAFATAAIYADDLVEETATHLEQARAEVARLKTLDEHDAEFHDAATGVFSPRSAGIKADKIRQAEGDAGKALLIHAWAEKIQDVLGEEMPEG